MAVLVSGVLAADMALARLTHLSGGFGAITDVSLAALGLAAVYLYAGWSAQPRFQQVCVLALWAVAITNVVTILILLAGRTAAPLADGSLAHIDAALHFSTGAVVCWVAGFPGLRLALYLSYQAVAPLILAALFVPALCGRERDSQRYLLSILIAAVITAAAFATWPAAGPWTQGGFAPSQDQAEVQAYLTVLKSAAPARVDFRSIGIVSFPSFHVVLALLSAIVLWRVRRIRYAAH
jgi:PAP2 superfamily protein